MSWHGKALLKKYKRRKALKTGGFNKMEQYKQEFIEFLLDCFLRPQEKPEFLDFTAFFGAVLS